MKTSLARDDDDNDKYYRHQVQYLAGSLMWDHVVMSSDNSPD